MFGGFTPFKRREKPDKNALTEHDTAILRAFGLHGRRDDLQKYLYKIVIGDHILELDEKKQRTARSVAVEIESRLRKIEEKTNARAS